MKTATQWIKDGCTDKEKICLECVFPELRESEDERIRKELIEFIKWSVDRHFMREDFHQAKRPSEWIAHLEKQKEYHIPWYDYQKSKEAGYTIVPNEEYEQLIKQKEQKPAWSEEDEKMRNLAIEWAETMYGQFRFVDMGSTDFRKIVAWLKSLRPSWKPGEEQMRDLEEAADNFANQDCARFTPRFNGFIAGAKWQKEQMMKEAVEGEIQMRYSGSLCPTTIHAINEDRFKLGDKVRIIIVKEDEK